MNSTQTLEDSTREDRPSLYRGGEDEATGEVRSSQMPQVRGDWDRGIRFHCGVVIYSQILALQLSVFLLSWCDGRVGQLATITA